MIFNFFISIFTGSDGVHEGPAGPTQAAQRGHRVYPGQLLLSFFKKKIKQFLFVWPIQVQGRNILGWGKLHTHLSELPYKF
jgi:hypothetical protein